MRISKIVLGSVALGASLLVTFTACSSGVSQSDYNAVKNQLATAQQQVTTLQKQLATATTAATGSKTLISAAKPSGGPPPSPPSGPKPTPPASLYQPVGTFFCSVETLTPGEPGPGGLAGNPVCAVSGVFARGEIVVWRFDVLNVSTGKLVTDQDAANVTVQLPNGQFAQAEFSERGGGSIPNSPWSWAAAFPIPTDYPVGSLPYTISITLKDGTTGTWTPEDINFPPAHVSSQIQVVN